MDFTKLLEPYNENGRTLGGQIKWLIQKNGLPQSSVDYAVNNVYTRIQNGEVFENGTALDHELRRVAIEYTNRDMGEQFIIRRTELRNEIKNEVDTENEAWNKLGNGFIGKMKKIKEVIMGRA